MPTYEMFWDCPTCGSTKLLGKTHRHCPNCGSAQDASWRYFPAEHEKVAVEDHVFVGVDLNCAHCQTPNSAASKHCVNCGAPIGDGDDERVGLVPTGQRAPDPEGVDEGIELDDWQPSDVADDDFGDHDDWAAAYQDEADEMLAYHAIKRRRTQKLIVFGIIGALVSSVLLFVVWNYWTRPATLQVSHHTWERRIAIEQLSSVSESGWCDSMPYDAYSVSRSQEVRSYNSIPDGESCSTVNVDNGDGTFSSQQSCVTTYREEPVYDDYCHYTVDRWVHIRTETASGRGLEPYWPSTSVSGCSSLGCTRKGAPSSDYNIHFVEIVDEPHRHVCDYDDEAKWRAMKNESRWVGRVRMLTGSLKCWGVEKLATSERR